MICSGYLETSNSEKLEISFEHTRNSLAMETLGKCDAASGPPPKIEKALSLSLCAEPVRTPRHGSKSDLGELSLRFDPDKLQIASNCMPSNANMKLIPDFFLVMSLSQLPVSQHFDRRLMKS